MGKNCESASPTRRIPPEPKYNMRYRFKGWDWSELFEACGMPVPDDKHADTLDEMTEYERKNVYDWDAHGHKDDYPAGKRYWLWEHATQEFKDMLDLLTSAASEPHSTGKWKSPEHHPLAKLTKKFCLAFKGCKHCYYAETWVFLASQPAYTRLMIMSDVLGRMWT